MHETSDFFYFTITFSYTKYFVHSYTADVVFTLYYADSPFDYNLSSLQYMGLYVFNWPISI